MIRKFVNRESELNSLNKIYAKPGLRFIIIYGRRRVGKTELIKKFSDQKNSIYFLADKRGTKKNVTRMAKLTASYFQDTEPKVGDFDELFNYILKRTHTKNLIITIDEFPYLIKKDNSIPSVFQLIVDEVIKNSNILLILSGSSVSMMENLLSKRSPLYGRRTSHFKLDPFKIEDVWKFFPKHKIEDIIKIYSITGGIPYYCSLLDPNKKVFENINKTILSKDGRLYEEIEFLLSEEFRDSSTYENILEAMSTGLSSLTKIANHAGMNAKDASSYLKTLTNLRIIRKEKPVTEKLRKKTNLYFIEDNFFKFWFRFIFENTEYIEQHKHEKLLTEKIEPELNEFIGKAFEDVALEWIKGLKEFDHYLFGRWWDRNDEIDIVGIDKERNEILFGEVKWKKLTLKQARQVLSKLKKKSEKVKWGNKPKKQIILITKRVEGKPELIREVHKVFELKDII